MEEIILDTFSDCMSDFLYYDRKEDEALEVGDIEKFLAKNPELIKKLVSKFDEQLRKSIEEYL